MRNGIFVTVEGPNGAGKSTFVHSLSQLLRQEYTVYTTKEPTESGFGKYVKKNPEALRGRPYAYLIAADRSYHVENYIKPHLETEEIVISDRYIESSLVLQAYDNVGLEDIWMLNSAFPVPELSIILSASESTLQKRLEKRNQLSYYESKMTRGNEVERYIRAEELIRSKGFHCLKLLNETEEDLAQNLSTTVQTIHEIRRKNDQESESVIA